MKFWNFETAECETMAAKFHWKLERDEAGIIRWVRDNGEILGNYFEIEYALLAMWRWLALELASK